MAGLLDFISTPEGQGLLSMVAGGLAGARRGAPINSLGIAGLAGLRGYDQAIQRQDEEPTRKMRDLQMQQLTKQMAQQGRMQEALKTAPQDVQNAVAMGIPYADIWKRDNPAKQWTEGFDGQGRPVKGWAGSNGFEQVGGAQASKAPEGMITNPDGSYGVIPGYLDMKKQISAAGRAPAQAYYQFLPTDKGYAVGNARTGMVEPAIVGGAPIMRATDSPALQGQIAEAKSVATPKFHEGAWMTQPTAQAPQGGMVKTPLYTPPKGSDEYRSAASTRLMPILDEADALLKNSTGSYAGAGVDLAARSVGISTQGAQAAAKLKAMEGAIMMAQPRMEGPQSDRDTELYRQMAGQIGNSTVPVETRQAALSTVRTLHQKYAGSGTTSGREPTGKVGAGKTAQPQAERSVVGTGTYNGKKVVKYSDGSIDYAD